MAQWTLLSGLSTALGGCVADQTATDIGRALLAIGDLVDLVAGLFS